ncbi:DMT family transporter [Methyloversatilis thermotolerans]|uniref:DMT family transporter n=1 Tax=Methyloversatilis thermotolerans TaxID=1346290 RepID=UPI00047540AD|nr:DMT family transporter [Methyloversatilis thermotolerans]
MKSLWMLLASVLFASMGVCVKLASEALPAAEIAFYRSFISLLLIGVFMKLRGARFATPHASVHLKRGLSGGVSLVLYFQAIAWLPLPTAVTLNYTSPLFMAAWLGLTSRGELSRPVGSALLLGFVGVVLVLQPSMAADQWLGGLCGLASGLIAAMAYLSVRDLGRLGEPEWRIVLYFSLCASLIAAAWTLVDGGFHWPAPGTLLLLAGVGSFGAAAQLCMTAAYKGGPTLVSASLAYTTVAFSTLFSLLLWNEAPAAVVWAGMALIVASGVLALLHPPSAKL